MPLAGVDVSHHLSLYYPTHGSSPAAGPVEAEAHADHRPERHVVGPQSADDGTSSDCAKGGEDTSDAIVQCVVRDTAPHHAENSPTTVCTTPVPDDASTSG